MVYHLNTPLAIDDDHPSKIDSIIAFCWRTSRPISRGSSEKICFLILRVKYREDKQGDEQQDGGDKILITLVRVMLSR